MKAGRDNWGYSSAGRAPALQAGGRRFDPDYLHQDVTLVQTQIANQRSVCDLKRRHSEMSELSPPGGSEGYGACVDDKGP